MKREKVFNIRYASIRNLDVTNGDGLGVALFVQGCPTPHCKGCFNPETWSFDEGKEWTEDVEKQFFELINRPYIKRISFLGGECLTKENLADITQLAKKCKEKFPKKKIWLWSRYDFETYISNLEIVNYLDYIVDGAYVEELRDISLSYRGSSNQNVWKKEIDDSKQAKWSKIVCQND